MTSSKKKKMMATMKKMEKTRLGARRARKILDFLARRTGYFSAKLVPHWSDKSISVVSFCASESGGRKGEEEASSGFGGRTYLNEDVMVGWGSPLQTLAVRTGSSEEDALERMLAEQESGQEVYVAGGPCLRERSSAWLREFGSLEHQLTLQPHGSPWVKIFLDGECLESLALKCDLEREKQQDERKRRRRRRRRS